MDAVLRVVIALVLVIGVMWLLAKLARRPLRGRSGGGLDVLARTQLSRGACVAVIRVEDTALVLGVTDNGVNLLHKTSAELFETPAPTRRKAVDLEAVRARRPGTDADPKRASALAGSAISARTWRQALEAIRERSVRRT